MLLLRLVMIGCLTTTIHTGLGWGQMIVAHRGASHDAPENTLSAFRLAWEKQSDGIEGDFYLTADQQIVCIHDKDTERTAGIKRIVERSTLAQLQELEYGGWKDNRWKGEQIPTFEQVLRTVPDGKTFVIELKSKQQIVPVLASELERLDTDSIKLLIITFDPQTCKACKERMPSIPVHWLTSFKRRGVSLRYQPSAAQIADTVRETGADGVGMKGMRSVVDADFIRQLKAGGCDEFHFWTIDSVTDARFLQQLGASGITTNRPALIRSGLDK